MTKESPKLIIACAPTEAALLRGFFDSGENSVMGHLERPGELRYAGWDLQTLDRAKIVKGEAWEVQNGQRKILRLYEDGTFIASVSAGYDFLGWGKSADDFAIKPRINPIAVVEFVYNFTNFYKELLSYFESKPRKLRLRLDLRNMVIDGHAMFVIPHEINTIGWSSDDSRYAIDGNDAAFSLDVDTTDLSAAPAAIAAKILERFFRLFGVPADHIPYVKKENDIRQVDLAKILKKG